jgi:hypothetical protein
MSEVGSEQSPNYTLERAVSIFDASKDSLFDPRSKDKPTITGVQSMISSGLDVTRAQQKALEGRGDLSWKQVIDQDSRPLSPHDLEALATDYERARDYLDGKRESSDSLKKLVDRIANERYRQTQARFNTDIEEAPRVLTGGDGGLFGIGGKDRQAVYEANQRQTDSIGRINDVLSMVEDKIKVPKTTE